MGRLVAIVGLVLLGCLAGCAAAPPPSTAVVHGIMLRPLLSDFPVQRALPLPAAGTVRALKGTSVVATAAVGESGKFSLRLPPGSYRLEGTPSQYPKGTTCEAARLVHAVAHKAVSAKVACRYALPR